MLSKFRFEISDRIVDLQLTDLERRAAFYTATVSAAVKEKLEELFSWYLSNSTDLRGNRVILTSIEALPCIGITVEPTVSSPVHFVRFLFAEGNQFEVVETLDRLFGTHSYAKKTYTWKI